jgi:hypothetical protein
MPGLIATAKAAQPAWPVLSVAEQVESAVAYQARVNADFAQRYINAGRGKAYAAEKAYLRERCCIAVEAITASPKGLMLSDIAEVLGLLENTAGPVARALVAKGAPYGVVRERLSTGYLYRRT